MRLLTHINGAAEKRAFLKRLLDDFEEVGRCLLQLIPLGNSTSEVLKALSGSATRERLIRSVQPARKGRHTNSHQAPYRPLLMHTAVRVPCSPPLLERGIKLHQLSQHCCFLQHHGSYDCAPFTCASQTSVLGKPSIKSCVIMDTGCRFNHSNDKTHGHHWKKKLSRPSNLPLQLHIALKFI